MNVHQDQHQEEEEAPVQQVEQEQEREGQQQQQQQQPDEDQEQAPPLAAVAAAAAAQAQAEPVAVAVAAAAHAPSAAAQVGAEEEEEEEEPIDVTMLLTRAERDRALAIKAIIEEDGRVPNLSDFEYVHWALTTQGMELDVVQEKIYIIYCFKQEYRIQDTLLEGGQLVHQFTFVQQPGALIHFEFLNSSMNYMSVEDFAAFNPQVIQSDDDYRIFLGGNYYLWTARQANFMSIRNGQTIVVECMGATFDNFDSHVMDKYMAEFFQHFPKKLKEQYYLNSPTVVNFTFGLIKPILPPEVWKKYHLGHQAEGYEGQRLDTLYNVPTPQAARERNLVRVLAALDLRYKNQAAFSLAKCRLM